MALSTRNVTKRLYEHAIARQLRLTNPAQAVVARFIATRDSRTRVLSPDEIGTVTGHVALPGGTREENACILLQAGRMPSNTRC
jgi:hypothetical protein